MFKKIKKACCGLKTRDIIMVSLAVIAGIGIFIVLMGVLYIVKPAVMQALMRFFKEGKRIYLAGLLRFVLAVIFLLGARESGVPSVIAAFGIIFLLSGLTIFLMGAKRINRILQWYLAQPTVILRITAFIALAAGVVIIYCAYA